MILTSFQTYLLGCVKSLRCMRIGHLEWLMRLKFESTPKQVETDIHQLQYMGLLCRKEGIVLMPGYERDGQMLAAVDIMRQLSEDTLPEFSFGNPPAKLSFFLEDQRGYLDFKVIPVLPGQEHKTVFQLEPQLSRFICTCIFVIQHEQQIPPLASIPKSFFALPDKNAGYRFLKAGATERGDAVWK